MKDLDQQKAKRKLKRNTFREALLQELNLEYRKQLSQSIKRGMARKKLSPN